MFRSGTYLRKLGGHLGELALDDGVILRECGEVTSSHWDACKQHTHSSSTTVNFANTNRSIESVTRVYGSGVEVYKMKERQTAKTE